MFRRVEIPLSSDDRSLSYSMNDSTTPKILSDYRDQTTQRSFLLQPKFKDQANQDGSLLKSIQELAESNLDVDENLRTRQSRPSRGSLADGQRFERSKGKSETTSIMNIELAQNSKWRLVAGKAKVMGRIAVQKKNILSTNYGIDENTADKEQEAENTRCILPNNRYYKKWRLLIRILTFYVLFIYIYRVSILSFEVDFLYIFEIFMQSCFLIDTVLNFITAYYDLDDLVTDLKTIMIHYALTFFLFDLMASLPVNLIALAIDWDLGDESQRILRMLPFFKVVRFSVKILMYEGWKDIPRLAKRSPTIIRLIKILMLVLYFVHFSACIFILLAKVENSNVTWIYLNSNQDSSSEELYIYAVYWATQTIVTVGFGDVTLTTNAERLIAIVLMYIGSAVYSFLVSNLGTIAEEADMFETSVKAKINAVKKLAKQAHLPNDLVQKVKKFIESNHKHNPRTSMKDQSYLEELPFTLKAQIMFYINGKVVEDVPFLKGKEIDFILRIAPNLKSIDLSQKEVLFREGEYPEDVYFLSAGIMHLKARTGTPLYVVSEGEIFGEVEALQELTRLSTAQAQSRCHLFSIEKERFNEILDSYPDVKEPLLKEALDKMKRLTDFKTRLKTNRGSGSNIMMGNHGKTNAMNTDDYMNRMYEKPNDRFESQIASYLEKGFGKKEKAKYVARLEKEPKRTSVFSNVQPRRSVFLHRISDLIEGSSKKNGGGDKDKSDSETSDKGNSSFIKNVLSPLLKARQSNANSHKSIRSSSFSKGKISPSPSPRNGESEGEQSVRTNREEEFDENFEVKEVEMIEEKKKEFEDQYFKHAGILQNDLVSTIETLQGYSESMKNQESRFDNISKLMNLVREKQNRIDRKLKICENKLLLGGSTPAND